MAQKKDVFKQVVKHKGYFNFSELYTFCFNWFSDEGYKTAEEEYQEKVSGNGKELIIKWVSSKKITDYIKFAIEIKWHILGLKDAEVEREGKKESTNKGDLKMTFTGIFISDYEEQWEKKPLWKFLRGIYDKYIVRTTLEEYESKLKSDAKDVIKDVKSYLQLEGV